MVASHPYRYSLPLLLLHLKGFGVVLLTQDLLRKKLIFDVLLKKVFKEKRDLKNSH